MATRFATQARRRAKAAEAWSHAGEAIGPIGPDTSLFVVTRGQFSMIDIIRHVLDELGPASISVWTLVLASYELEVITALMEDRRVVDARLVIDLRGEERNPELLATWRALFGADRVRTCRNHAKMARVWTADRRVLIRGSLNLNANPRFENVDLTVNGPEFDLVADIEAALPILPPGASNHESWAASGLTKASEARELSMIQGLKTWQG